MKRVYKIILIGFLSVFFFCSRDITSIDDSSVSAVQIEVTLSEANASQIGLGKPAVVNTFRVTVTGPGMAEIVKTGTRSGNTVVISLSVPKGNNRVFTVEGLDGNNIVQYEGSTTKNIVNNTENVSINVQRIAPPPVSLTVTQVTPVSATLSWTASTAPDFKSYLVLLALTSNLDPNNPSHVLGEITDRNQTEVDITNLTPGTPYYTAVIPIDTEDFYNTGFQVENFTTPASTWELSYDDGSQEGGLRGPTGSWLTVTFDAPQYPVKILSIYYYIYGNAFGNEIASLIYDNASMDVIYATMLPATSDGWISVTPDWNSVVSDGVVNSPFDAGVEFQVDNGPFVGCDTNSTYIAGTQWYRYPDLTWARLDEVGFSWNLMIRAEVELATGGTVELVPSRISAQIRKSGGHSTGVLDSAKRPTPDLRLK
ncbi:MAG: hypothetical protein Kow0042_03790 [Calditrichia bacterium]